MLAILLLSRVWAFQLDANNSRAYVVAGRKYLYSPKMFGGDLDKAIDSFRGRQRLIRMANYFLIGILEFGTSLWSITWALLLRTVHFRFPYLVAFAAAMTAVRVLIAWVYVNTKSVLLAQFMHISSTGSLVIFSPARVTAAQETLWYSVYAIAITFNDCS